MDSAYVLDSFALLAHLEGEARGARVTELLNKSQTGKTTLFMSVINLGEVYYITLRERGKEIADETLMLIGQLPIKMIDADKELTLNAAKLKAQHTAAYADCFAAALAIQEGVKVVTGDPEFRNLAKHLKVLWI